MAESGECPLCARGSAKRQTHCQNCLRAAAWREVDGDAWMQILALPLVDL